MAVVAGAGLLGIGGWFLTRGDTATEPAAPAPVEEPAPESPSSEPETGPAVVAEPAPESSEPGTGREGDEIGEVIRRSESSLVILVRGPTVQGWAIESPDNFGFYPIGPAGPETFTETVSTGFAQSPEGAGFAALHILQRLNPLNPDWKIAAENQLIGPGAGAYISAAEQFGATSSELDELREVSALKDAWIGWSVTSFDPQAAEFRLAGIGSIDEQEVRFTTDVRLEWIDGDWRLVTAAADASDLTAINGVIEHGPLDIDMREAFAL